MRWIVPAVAMVAIAACGGPKVPQHAGYRNEKAKPWKKPKVIKLDDKLEGKTDGELSYADHRRARWFAVDLPRPGALDLRLEITPPGEATNEDFDLAIEVLDPGYRVISKSDLEDEDAFELTKTKSLLDLAAGRHYIHLYLQGRMDVADYVLNVTFKPAAPAEIQSDFPAQVAFVPALPMVPLNDDTPKSYKPPTTAVVKVIRTKKNKPPKPEPTATPTTLSARIIGIQVVSGGTQITVGKGTASGAATGMRGKINGIASGGFTLASCNERTCQAVVNVTPDQIKSAGGNVVLSP